MDLRKDNGRTYRFYTGDVTYPFGTGLGLVPTTIAMAPPGQ